MESKEERPRGGAALMENLLRRLTSRKLHSALVIFLTASGFVIYGYMDSETWAELMQWIFVIYAAGNSAEHITEWLKTRR